MWMVVSNLLVRFFLGAIELHWRLWWCILAVFFAFIIFHSVHNYSYLCLRGRFVAFFSGEVDLLLVDQIVKSTSPVSTCTGA